MYAVTMFSISEEIGHVEGILQMAAMLNVVFVRNVYWTADKLNCMLAPWMF